jgi:hypothetical protein
MRIDVCAIHIRFTRIAQLLRNEIATSASQS